jgi:uncharacterized protein YoxC
VAIKKEIEIDVNSKGAVEGIDNTSEAVEGLNTNIDTLNEKLDDTSKQMKKSAGDIEDTGKKASKAGNLFQKAGKLLSNIGKTISSGFGLGIGIKLFDKFTEILSQNQVVVDTVNTVFTTLSIVVNKVFDAVSEAFNAVSEANGGFNATKEVLGSLITIALTPLKVLFYTLKAAVIGLQLAWEESFLGDNDPERIKELNAALEETKEDLIEVGTKAIEAGKNIGNNIKEAIQEVTEGAVAIIEAGADAIEKIDLKAEAARAKSIVERQKQQELLEVQQQALIEQYDLQAEKQRQLRDDTNLSIQERIEANRRLGEVLTEQAELEKRNIRSRIGFLYEQQNALGATQERTVEIAQLNAELAAVDARIEGQRSEQLTSRNALLQENIDLLNSQRESQARIKEIEDQAFLESIEQEDLRLAKEIEILEAKKAAEEEFLQSEIERYNEGTQARIDAENKYAEYKAETDAKLNQLDKQYSDARIKREKAVQDAKINALTTGLSSIGTILGSFADQNKDLAKAAVIADAAVAAIGIWRGWSSFGPFGIAGAVAQTAALGFATAASLRQIDQAETGVSSIPAPTPTTGVPTGANFSVANNQSVAGATASNSNALLGNINQNTSNPVKAYVVSSEVSTQQELDRKTKQNSSFG